MAKVSARSAKPGTQDASAKKAKKEKVEKVAYRADDADKLESVPEDFDPKKHKPLKRSDFACESTWCILKAEELEAKAKAMRDEAELIKKGGGKKAAAKANRLKKMMDRMEQLKKELGDEGVDVEELMATLVGDDEE